MESSHVVTWMDGSFCWTDAWIHPAGMQQPPAPHRKTAPFYLQLGTTWGYEPRSDRDAERIWLHHETDPARERTIWHTRNRQGKREENTHSAAGNVRIVKVPYFADLKRGQEPAREGGNTSFKNRRRLWFYRSNMKNTYVDLSAVLLLVNDLYADG